MYHEFERTSSPYRSNQVSNSAPKKDFGPIDKWHEMSGLYKLGFDFESLKGFMLPFMAMGVPIVLAFVIWKWL
jgi:hypothetical protein